MAPRLLDNSVYQREVVLALFRLINSQVTEARTTLTWSAARRGQIGSI